MKNVVEKNFVMEILSEHKQQIAEKVRVAAIVKKMNQDNKKNQKRQQPKESNKTKRKPVRFPGT